jgi:hypothetical protein
MWGTRSIRYRGGPRLLTGGYITAYHAVLGEVPEPLADHVPTRYRAGYRYSWVPLFLLPLVRF